MPEKTDKKMIRIRDVVGVRSGSVNAGTSGGDRVRQKKKTRPKGLKKKKGGRQDETL